MPPKNKINLKDRLEDGELDLSMSDLQEVPVKDIAVLRKVTSLELSNNRLTTLGKNFTSLTFLVKLDLSKNFLKELPENFGELKQLKHLDLYSNELTHLPLSFSELKLLKWLDLKNNPLVPAVGKVAGPCLDQAQCQQCAKNIVAFFTQMQQHIAAERDRLELERQQELEKEEALMKEKQKKKEKKKAAKAKKYQKKIENNVVLTHDTYEFEAPIQKIIKKKVVKPKKKSSNVWILIKYAFRFIFAAILFLFMLSAAKVEMIERTRENVLSIWNIIIPYSSDTIQPLLIKFGYYVQNVHEYTGFFIEKILLFVEQTRESETYKNINKAILHGLNVMIDVSKKLFEHLNHKLVLWGQELREKIS